MTYTKKIMIAGNWKMNGSLDSLKEISSLRTLISNPICDVVICPPTILLCESLKVVRGSKIMIGAQNCHHKVSGAYTGEISASMLNDVGIKTVILGHSERRVNNFETSSLVQEKIKTAHDSDLATILCVGETEKERVKGLTNKIIENQLTKSLPSTAHSGNTILAYEPIWAIGSGKTPTSMEIMNINVTLRKLLSKLWSKSEAKQTRILYGGSVNPENCYNILSIDGVDGALVGGASIKASDFSQIIKCTEKIIQ